MSRLKSEVGRGSEPNQEFVQFRFARSCVRARGLAAYWNSISKAGADVFPFPVCHSELSFFHVCQQRFPFSFADRSEIEVESILVDIKAKKRKWHRSESKMDRSEIEVISK